MAEGHVCQFWHEKEALLQEVAKLREERDGLTAKLEEARETLEDTSRTCVNAQATLSREITANEELRYELTQLKAKQD